jgi:hypothetical protein
MASHESRLRAVRLPPKSFAPSERSESPASEEWGVISSAYHDEETEGKVGKWRGSSDTMLGGVMEPWPSTGGEDGDG